MIGIALFLPKKLMFSAKVEGQKGFRFARTEIRPALPCDRVFAFG